MKISKKRLDLLMKLESIVGNECYNANIQNWGPNATWEGAGREFRYPINFVDPTGKKIKRSYTDASIAAKVAVTGYYAFGANQLHIIRALDKVIQYLETNNQLKI